MTSPFLTIAEASEKTGRSASTVRRFIHAIAEDDSHPDRDALEPSVKKVAAFKKKNENFTWKIREDVLLKEFSGAPSKAKKTLTGSGDDILKILQRELDLKNNQIEKQFEVIQSLNDRLREGNILMGSLQKQLALPSSASSHDDVVEAVAEKVTTEAVKKASKQAPKKKFLQWLRG